MFLFIVDESFFFFFFTYDLDLGAADNSPRFSPVQQRFVIEAKLNQVQFAIH